MKTIKAVVHADPAPKPKLPKAATVSSMSLYREPGQSTIRGFVRGVDQLIVPLEKKP